MNTISRLLCLLSLTLGMSGCVIAPEIALFGSDRRADQTEILPGAESDSLLLINIHGVISSSPSSSLLGFSSSPSLLEVVDSSLRRAEKDKTLRGIIVHINSPGGGVAASDELYQLLVDFKQRSKLPIVAVLGDLAASGGYYVACAADHIIAQPAGVTGSIGVLLARYDATGLLKKVGLRDETLHSGRLKTMLSPTRPASEEEVQLAQGMIDAMHARFKGIVRENRAALKTADLSSIADGRLFTSQQALSVGLVDAQGRLPDAVEWLREHSKAPEARLIRYENVTAAGNSIYSVSRDETAPAALSQQQLAAGLLSAASRTPMQTGARFMYIWPGAL